MWCDDISGMYKMITEIMGKKTWTSTGYIKSSNMEQIHQRTLQRKQRVSNIKTCGKTGTGQDKKKQSNSRRCELNRDIIDLRCFRDW